MGSYHQCLPAIGGLRWHANARECIARVRHTPTQAPNRREIAGKIAWCNASGKALIMDFSSKVKGLSKFAARFLNITHFRANIKYIW
jgi:hypothetical protein